MKLEIGKKELLEGLNAVSKAISGKGLNPILDGMHFVAKDGQLVLTGSDSSMTIIKEISDVEITEDGNIIIEPRILGEIVRRLPDAAVNIETEENLIIIKCLSTKFSIPFVDGADYPTVEVEADGDEIEINQDSLKDCVKGVAFAASIDDTRPILKGILFELKDSAINFVALDGYRLAKKSIGYLEDRNIQSVVDARSFLEATKLMNSSEDNVVIKMTRNHIIFTFNSTTVMSKLLEGNFINYSSLLPVEFATKVQISKNEIIGSLERANLIGDSGNKLVKITVSADGINVSAKSTIGQLTEDLSAEVDGTNELTIAFNSKYLLDAIRSIGGDNIILNLNSSISPCVVKGVEDLSGEYLVLPVRLA